MSEIFRLLLTEENFLIVQHCAKVMQTNFVKRISTKFMAFRGFSKKFRLK